MLLCQRPEQSIAEYVREAENLSQRVPADMSSMLAMVFVKGLADQETRRRISYDLRDDPEFTFSTVSHMVKSWYQEIGAPDPFRPNSVGFNSYREKQATPVYAKPTTGAVASAQTLGAVNSPTPAVGLPTQEQFNQMMLNFMGTMKQDFRSSPHRTPIVINTASGGIVGSQGVSDNARGAFGNEPRAGRAKSVVCFNCGGSGHFATGCTNPPLTYLEQKRIRDEFRIEREAWLASGSMPVSGTNNDRSTTLVAANVGSTVRVSPSAIGNGERITEVTAEKENLQASTISCIEVVSVAADRAIVGEACYTLMRMPAVAAIFKKAMVDKRVPVEDWTYEETGRATKLPRTHGPATGSGAAGSSSGVRQPPQVLHDSSSEPETEDETPIQVAGPRPAAV